MDKNKYRKISNIDAESISISFKSVSSKITGNNKERYEGLTEQFLDLLEEINDIIPINRINTPGTDGMGYYFYQAVVSFKENHKNVKNVLYITTEDSNERYCYYKSLPKELAEYYLDNCDEIKSADKYFSNGDIRRNRNKLLIRDSQLLICFEYGMDDKEIYNILGDAADSRKPCVIFYTDYDEENNKINLLK